jgi:hypothetical protein
MFDDERLKAPEKETRPTRGEWGFADLPKDRLDEVGLRAVRAFVEKSVMKESPYMGDFLKEKYLDETPDLHEFGESFGVPESENNNIEVDFTERKIYMYPHFGRGSAEHDVYLANAIEAFDAALVDGGIECTRELTRDDPKDRGK